MKRILIGIGMVVVLFSGCTTSSKPSARFPLHERENANYKVSKPVADARTERHYAVLSPECNDAPAGVALDSQGCPVPLYLKVALSYQSTQLELDPAFLARINKIGRILSDNPNSQAVIAGHSDTQTDEQLARLASQQRATAVKQAIVKKYQISPERLQIMVHGGTRPLVSNATESGRQRNRRVEIILTGYYRAGNAMAAGTPRDGKPGATFYFNPGETDALKQFQTELDALGKYLAEHPDTVATIDGYTDSKGPAHENLLLSQRRADAVKNYLGLRYYIPAERLKSTGHGMASPVASNDSDAGRQKNRRVVVALIRQTDALPESPLAQSQPAAQGAPVSPVASVKSEPMTSAQSTPALSQTAAAQPAQQYQNPAIELPRKRTRFIGELAVSERNTTLPKTTALPTHLAIHFGNASAIPDQASLPELDRLGQALKANPQARIVIESYSDKAGSKGATLSLAHERGEYVKNYLISMYEISADRVRLFNYGANMPVASNSTGAERTGAQQVEVKVNP